MSGIDHELHRGADIRRPLGSTERTMHLYSKAHPRHFCVAIELTGSVEPEHFVDAFKAVQRRHPLLSAAVGLDASSKPCIVQSSAPLCVDIKRWKNGLRWERLVETELTRAFTDDLAPLMRATVRYLEDRVLVVLTFHHVLADGMSAVFIVRDLMCALDQQELAPLANTESLDTRAAANALSSKRDDVPGALSLDADMLRQIAASPLWRPFKGDEVHVSGCILDVEMTGRLRDACRARGTTMHGALCAAVALSGAAVQEKDNFKIATAINLRKVVGSGEDECGLLAGFGTVTIAAPRKTDFWDMAHQTIVAIQPMRTLAGVRDSIRVLDTLIPPWADSALAVGIIGSIRYDAVVTNLGELAIPLQTGDLKLTAFWGPAVQGRFKNEIVVGAASLAGQLHLVQSSPRHIESILFGVRHNLLAALADV